MTARLLGVREEASFELARRWDAAERSLRRNADDASFLGDGARAAPGGYAAVSLSTHVGGADRDAAVAALAGLLDAVADETGLEIVVHAHFGSLRAGEVRGDGVLHRDVAERMRHPVRVEPTVGVIESARFARRAAMVVTSRYHPAVFAVPGGVPTIGIPVDEYTTVKLRGALTTFGQDGLLPLDRVADAGAHRVRATWARRDAIREAGRDAAERVRAASRDWWDRLAAELG